MQIEYSLESAFAAYGEETTGVAWTLEDRLDEEKSVQFAAYLISQSLIKYDCDYLKMIQAYNFGQTVLDRILDAAGDDWLTERINSAKYASNWPYEKYGDAEYIEHVLRYYHNDIEYIGVKVRINGELLSFDGQYPLLETAHDGETYTLIPIRGVSEALGADVTWDASNQKVDITKDGHTVTLTIGSDTAVSDGEEITLDADAEIRNDRTLVPLRFVMESFDADVEWDGDTRTVFITA
jgi:hypothetical protein